MKYGGYGDIHNQAKNRDWQLKYKEKSNGSSYGQKTQVPATTLEEDIEYFKNVFDPRSEEQKARDKELKVQKQKEKNSVKSHLYYGNIIKLNDTPLEGENRKVHNDKSIKNMISSYKWGIVNEYIVCKPYKYNINEDEFTVSEYRSMIFPEKLRPYFEEATLKMIPKDQHGKSLDEGAAWFKVTYAKSGQLNNMSISHKPYVGKNPSSPVLIVVNDELCTLTVSSGHFKHLSSIIEKTVDVLSTLMIKKCQILLNLQATVVEMEAV